MSVFRSPRGAAWRHTYREPHLRSSIGIPDYEVAGRRAKEEPVAAMFRYASLDPLSFPSKTAAAAAI
jgi:hypothetical protein